MHQDFRNGFEKVANRLRATTVGAIPSGDLASLGAAAASKKGRGFRTAVGSSAGRGMASIGTGVLLASLGRKGIYRPSAGAATGLLLLADSLGGGLGAYLAHGKDKK